MSDHDEGDGTRLHLGSGDTELALGPPDIPDPGENWVRMPLRLRAANLVATASLELTGWGGWVPAFLRYFDDLGRDWRGWDGERLWLDDSAAVELRATHDGVSEIHLTVRLMPYYGSTAAGSWEVTVVVPIEAGRMADIPNVLRAMLSGVGVPMGGAAP